MDSIDQDRAALLETLLVARTTHLLLPKSARRTFYLGSVSILRSYREEHHEVYLPHYVAHVRATFSWPPGQNPYLHVRQEFLEEPAPRSGWWIFSRRDPHYEESLVFDMISAQYLKVMPNGFAARTYSTSFSLHWHASVTRRSRAALRAE